MANNYDPYDEATQVQSNQQQAADAGAADPSAKSDQKKAVVAAAVGTAALGGAAYGLSMLEDSENADNNPPPDDNPPPPDPHDNLANNGNTPPDHTPPVEPTPPINPDPSGLTGFEKAFYEARLAQGPGHTFVYEGQTYNTYTKEEEAMLTPEERQEFLAANNLAPSGHGHPHDLGQGPATGLASNDPDNFPEIKEDEQNLQSDHQASNQDGSSHATAASYNPAGNDDPDISVITVDGHDVALVDINHDHEADIVLADDGSVLLDTDGDHHYDTEGFYNAETHQFEHLHTVDPVDTIAMHDDNTHYDSADSFDDLADFDNHADISDFT